MSKHINASFIALITVLLFPFATQAQSGKKEGADYLSVYDSKGKPVPFKIKIRPSFELRNGLLSMVVSSQDNAMFQVNGIREASIKDTTLKGKGFRLVYLTAQPGKTFASNEKSTSCILTVKCRSRKAGSSVQFIVKGKVYEHNAFYTIEGQFTGEIPEKKYTSIQSN